MKQEPQRIQPGQANPLNHADPIAKKESQIVFWSRVFLILVLLLAAVSTSFFTYFLTSKEEYDDFTSEFAGFAAELLSVSKHNADTIITSTNSLGVSITTFAAATNQTWPFVTVPNFEAISQISQADGSGFMPIVKKEQKLDWEAYVLDNFQWIFESWNYQYNQACLKAERENLEPPTPPPSYDEASVMFSHWIYQYNIEEANLEEDIDLSKLKFDISDNPQFAPIWQISPLSRDKIPINFDYFGNERVSDAFEELNRTHLPVIVRVPVFSDVESMIFEPIFDTVEYDRKVVGMVFTILNWARYFENLLSDAAVRVIVVMKDACGEALTIEIRGARAAFLGLGDLHDPKYNDLEKRSVFNPSAQSDNDDCVPEVEGGHQGCCHTSYSIHVYPSDELKSEYETSMASYYTAGVVGIFLFATMVFILYDVSVKKRLDTVMTRAVQSDTIVSSLFPSNVRDRLYASDDEDASPRPRRRSSKITVRNHLKSQFKNNTADEEAGCEEGAPPRKSSKPIADLFPHCTIMFGDIAGFTSWSSTRQPAQVFELLEALYGAFDKLANKYGVFKVETIGDCYVAVTGLPDPREDHALIMAKFARDCMDKMKKVTHELEDSLGPDTGDLAMRIGLHSGPVTAGVLRGEKSRFQLFGDTVNTASRMESTGQRERIQISQTTADLLCAHGLAYLIAARDGAIPVKGKGSMQTYWLYSHAEAKAVSLEGSSELETSSVGADGEENGEQHDDDFDSCAADLDEGSLHVLRLKSFVWEQSEEE